MLTQMIIVTAVLGTMLLGMAGCIVARQNAALSAHMGDRRQTRRFQGVAGESRGGRGKGREWHCQVCAHRSAARNAAQSVASVVPHGTAPNENAHEFPAQGKAP